MSPTMQATVVTPWPQTMHCCMGGICVLVWILVWTLPIWSTCAGMHTIWSPSSSSSILKVSIPEICVPSRRKQRGAWLTLLRLSLGIHPKNPWPCHWHKCFPIGLVLHDDHDELVAACLQHFYAWTVHHTHGGGGEDEDACSGTLGAPLHCVGHGMVEFVVSRKWCHYCTYIPTPQWYTPK